MLLINFELIKLAKKIFNPDQELNPGLPHDTQRSSPLDYQGLIFVIYCISFEHNQKINNILIFLIHDH